MLNENFLLKVFNFQSTFFAITKKKVENAVLFCVSTYFKN